MIVQVSLSLVLLVGAGLFLRSLRSAASIDLGFRADNVLLMAVDPKLHNYSAEKDEAIHHRAPRAGVGGARRAFRKLP